MNKKNLRPVLTVIGFAVFAVLVIVTVIVAKKLTTTQAPTAPESRPSADVVRTQTCTLEFDVTVDLECNSECTGDAECEAVNPDYTCSVEYGNRCRLISYPSSETCTPPGSPTPTPSVSPTPTPSVSPTPTPSVSPTPTPSVSPTPTPSITPSPTPTPSPAPGCNEPCVTNADCSNPAHICYQTSDGLRCRLDIYPESPYCVPPASPTPTPTQTTYVPGQPGEAPQVELPQAGILGPTKTLIGAGVGSILLGLLGILLLL